MAPAGESVVAYQSACSLQHGQQVTDLPQRLLEAAGYKVRTPPRLTCAADRPARTTCCSRRLPAQLGERKVANLERTRPDVIATGNIGCWHADQPARFGPSRSHRGAARLGNGWTVPPGASRRHRLRRGAALRRESLADVEAHGSAM